jgi:hypothetical protein
MEKGYEDKIKNVKYREVDKRKKNEGKECERKIEEYNKGR